MRRWTRYFDTDRNFAEYSGMEETDNEPYTLEGLDPNAREVVIDLMLHQACLTEEKLTKSFGGVSTKGRASATSTCFMTSL